MPIVLLLAQAVAAVPAPGSALPDRVVLPLVVPSTCPSGDDEVVVCGRRDPDRYRLRALPDRPEATPPRAELGLFGRAKGSATVEQKAMPGGAVSNRVMFNIKLPF